MTTYPDAPWRLTGESVLAWASLPVNVDLPSGIRRMPGPALVGAVAFGATPVGHYREMFVAVPARLGLRPGFCVVLMVVDSAASRMAGRLSWGLPKELGTLTWSVDGPRRSMRWHEREVVVTGRASRWPVPFVLPLRNLQRRADGPVITPGRVSGRARFGRVEVEVQEDDPLAVLAGSHRGAVVLGMHMVQQPARLPAGLLSTLNAPLRSAEPATFRPLGEPASAA